MATRTIQTGDDIESALLFLAKESGVSSEQYFMDKIGKVSTAILDEADEKRFELVKKTLDEKNKGQSISKLREILGG